MTHITTSDDCSLYMKVWGTGQPVILIHGWPLSADSWDDQAMALAASGYKAIAYDRRGFGRSSQPWNGYDYDTLADDLAAVIEQTGSKDAVLIGFSMGGGEIARYLSRHAGKSVAKAVLISSVVPFMLKTDDNPDGTEHSVFAKMAQGILEDRAGFFGDFFKTFFGASLISHPVSTETLEWARALAMQASLKATLDCAKAFSNTDFRPDLGAFDLPTLIIHGTSDKTVPIDAAGRAAHRGIPQSTLIEYEGAPHGLFATEKARLTQDLLKFLGQKRETSRGLSARAATEPSVDTLFVDDVSQGGMYEVEASKLAASRATAPGIKSLAAAEVHDHELVNAKLKTLAQASGIPMAARLNPMFQQRLAKLAAASADDFDRAYIDDMKQIHDKDEKLFAKESMDGTGDFKAFAHETDLIVRNHIGALNGTE